MWKNTRQNFKKTRRDIKVCRSFRYVERALPSIKLQKKVLNITCRIITFKQCQQKTADKLLMISLWTKTMLK